MADTAVADALRYRIVHAYKKKVYLVKVYERNTIFVSSTKWRLKVNEYHRFGKTDVSRLFRLCRFCIFTLFGGTKTTAFFDILKFY